MTSRKGFLFGFDLGLMIMILLCKLSFERFASDKRNSSLNLVYNTRNKNFKISRIHKAAAFHYKYDKIAEVTKVKVPSLLSKNAKDETSQNEKNHLNSYRDYAFDKFLCMKV